MKKSNLLIIVCIIIAMMQSACSGDKSNSNSPVKSIEFVDVPANGIDMLSGDTKKLEIRTNPQSVNGIKYIWSSSAATVVSVSQDGTIRAYEKGTATVTVMTSDKTVKATVEVRVKSHDDNYDFTASGKTDGYEYVDMGLSVKWATCNLGGKNKTDIGEYYAWQETKPYTEYTWVNYFFTFNPCDKNNILSSIYDAVSMNWSKNWRMPTYDEMAELIKPENCDWYWYDDFENSGNAGYVVKSKKTKKCIFLAAGNYKAHEDFYNPQKVQGRYWTSWAGVQDMWKNSISAMSLHFVDGLVSWGTDNRGDGLTIRGVVGKANEYIPESTLAINQAETDKQGFSVCGFENGYTYVDLGLPSRTMWATFNVGSKVPSDYGNFYAWGETTPKQLYNHSTYKFFTGEYGGDYGSTSYHQYNKYIIFEPHGKPDYKTCLDSEDDAATVNWGAAWCMPTSEQVEELGNYCAFKRKDIVVNGKKIIGCIGTSKINGNSIYLPAAGWEYDVNVNDYMQVWYWTSDLAANKNGGDDYRANFMTFHFNDNLLDVQTTSRMQGLPVRAVLKTKK